MKDFNSESQSDIASMSQRRHLQNNQTIYCRLLIWCRICSTHTFPCKKPSEFKEFFSFSKFMTKLSTNFFESGNFFLTIVIRFDIKVWRTYIRKIELYYFYNSIEEHQTNSKVQMTCINTKFLCTIQMK